MAPLPFCVHTSYLYANESGRGMLSGELVRVKGAGGGGIEESGVAAAEEQMEEENLEEIRLLAFY